MPWTKDEAAKHKKGLTGSERKRWAKIANAVYSETGDEGKAIRIANANCRAR